MFQTWDKLIETGDEPLTKTVRVIDEYRINEGLIDLRKQPLEIIKRMDVAIQGAIDSEIAPLNVGMHFLKFCKQHDLPSLEKESNDHVIYLNKKYQKAIK